VNNPGASALATPNSSASDFVPRRTPEAWAFAAVAAIAGVLAGLFYGGVVGAARQASGKTPELLSLRPYLDPGFEGGAGGWLAPALRSPVLMALVLGLSAGLLVLVCDAALRRVFLASKPGAAGLGGIAILLAPALGTALRIEGHFGVLAGAPLALAGSLLAIERRRSRFFLAEILIVLAAAVHPAWIGAVPVLLAASPLRAAAAGALAIALTAFSAWGVGVRPIPDFPFDDRWRWALRDLAAAPVLAFSPWRRLDVPTGYEALVGAPVVLGLAIHALVLGIGMMIGGIRAGLIAALAAASSVFASAFAVRGWIPGDRAFVLPATFAYAPLVALVLGSVPAGLARAALPGCVLGAGVVAVLIANDRAPALTTIGSAIDLPREKSLGGQVISIRQEKDPARLVLFLHELGLADAYSPATVQAADALLDSGAPALFSFRLKEMLDQKMSRAGRKRADAAFDALVKEVESEIGLAEHLFSQAAARNFITIAEAVVGVHTKVLELRFNWPNEFGTVKNVQAFRRIAQHVIPAASRSAYYEYSIPLLEAIQNLGPETAETAGTIALQKFFAGDPAGVPELEAVLPRLPPKGPFAPLVRGLLGISLLKKGDPAAALRELQASWTVLGQGGVKNVTVFFGPDTADYAIVGEILLARFEAAIAVDPQLAPQAAKDVEEFFKGQLTFGRRRLPPLAIVGRLELLLGNREKALTLLREARVVPHESMEDRSDGPLGRIAQPRLRRFALENLLLALGDDPANVVERGEVAEELRALKD
jgi:hypothetical protein